MKRTIPKYVQEMMGRSRYEYDFCTNNVNYAAGFTIRIRKASAYTLIGTLHNEIVRLCKWTDRIGGVGTAVLLYIPKETHHCEQSAVVTIFDPVMNEIEKYIND